MSLTKRLSLGCMAVIAALLLALTVADPTFANSRIRAGQCDVYQTVALDPIAKTTHLHHFIMGAVLSNNDTGLNYKSRAFSSCRSEDNWATSGGWYPKAQTFDSYKSVVYYRDPGNILVRPIPTDLRMLSTKVIYKGRLTTVNFGNCLQVDAIGNPILDSVDHRSHIEEKNANACDSSHPYRIPDISYLISWNGNLTASTPVSHGTGQYIAGTFHADYHAGVQDEFNFQTSAGRALIDLCLNDVPLSVDVASPRCGVGP
jgi:hypothetical protein